MPMWCMVPLEMNGGNWLGARVQSAYRLQCRKGPTRDLFVSDKSQWCKKTYVQLAVALCQDFFPGITDSTVTAILACTAPPSVDKIHVFFFTQCTDVLHFAFPINSDYCANRIDLSLVMSVSICFLPGKRKTQFMNL